MYGQAAFDHADDTMTNASVTKDGKFPGSPPW